MGKRAIRPRFDAMAADAATPPPSDSAGVDASQRWASVQAALDRLDDGFSLYDSDLRLIAWNARFLALMEFPEEYARIGEPFEAFVRYNVLRGEYGPGDPEALVRERVELARRFLPHSFERVRPNGTVLEIRGNPIPGVGFVTIYKDITERKRAERALQEAKNELERRVAERTATLESLNERLTREVAERRRALEALRESEEWVRLVADTVPALIGYVDAGETYRFANRRFQEWFGRPPVEIVGRSSREVLGPEHYRAHEPRMKMVLSGRTVTAEFPLVVADGREIRAATTLIPHVDDGGAVLGYFILGQDVTERRQSEAALRQAQKMKAIGQLTGGLAHDFNNLLTIIIGNLAVLHEEIGDGSARDLLDPALDAARRGAQLVKRLLSFARQQPLQQKVIDVGGLVAGMAQLLRQSLGASIEVAFDLPGALWPVRADPHQLENAILNLAINGRDAMPGGGRLEIAVRHARIDDAYALRRPDAAPGDYVVISVADNGHGMRPEVVERAFEPFFTTKDIGQGSGMGLSMVYGLVRQSGGHAEIDSRVGGGTTVRLFLPRSTDVDAEAAREAPTRADVPTGTERVLVVEDDSDVRRFAANALRGLGYDVVEAAGGRAALSVLKHEDGVALLLTDVMMPGGLSGPDLAHRARRRRPELRVLFMSGYPDEAVSSAGEPAPLLAKPFQKEELARAVRRVLDAPV